jgi:hypothetical protein
MTSDFRSLCAELAGWIERSTRHYIRDPDVLIRARAALAEPEDISYEFIISGPDYCTQAGGMAPSLQQAIDNGRHYLAQYLQDGLHILEVRRIETVFTSTGEDQ